MFRLGILFICIPFTIFAKDPPFEKFLTTHCVSCHGPKKEKGDLRIDTLARDFKAGIGLVVVCAVTRGSYRT